MDKTQKILQQIIDEIENSVSTFDKSIQPIQQNIVDELQYLLKDLDIRNGVIVSNVKNLKLISKLTTRLNTIILSDGYNESVLNFVNTFDTITSLQNDYFKALGESVSTTDYLKELQKVNIEATLNSLTESGINANLVEPIQSILRTNITSGASFKELNKQIKTFMVDDASGLGALSRYSTQITTDSLNQYSRQYHDTLASNYGYEWYQYVGSNKVTTREFCKYLTAKRYVNRKEFDNLLNGKIDDHQCIINKKTDLPLGMIAGTNENTLITYCGGYQCGHGMYAIKDVLVPIAIRNKFK